MAISTVKVTVDGQEYTLTYNSTSGKYEATLTAPSKSSGSNNSGQGVDIGSNAQGLGYYPVSVAVTDDAGNVTSVGATDSTWGNTLRLAVLETDLPVAAITYPTAGARIITAQPTFTFTITDSGSGVDPTTCYIKIDTDSAQAVTPTIVGGVATCSYTPATALAEGSHTIEVYGTDYDGNESVHATASFYIDITAPVLNVTTPADNLITNNAQLTVSGTTNDATSSPVTLKITVGSTEYTPSVDSTTGAFSQVVALAEGSNTVTITATDSAGLTTTVVRTVTLDTVAPTIVSIVITDNPTTTGTSYTIEVEVSDS